jgi:hypothetical protein
MRQSFLAAVAVTALVFFGLALAAFGFGFSLESAEHQPRPLPIAAATVLVTLGVTTLVFPFFAFRFFTPDFFHAALPRGRVGAFEFFRAFNAPTAEGRAQRGTFRLFSFFFSTFGGFVALAVFLTLFVGFEPFEFGALLAALMSFAAALAGTLAATAFFVAFPRSGQRFGNFDQRTPAVPERSATFRS